MIQTECTKMSIQVWSATINQVSQFIYTATNYRQIGKNTKSSRQSSHDEENYVKSLVKSINSSRLPHWLLRPLSSNFYILYKQEKRRKSIKQWKVSRSNNNVRYPENPTTTLNRCSRNKIIVMRRWRQLHCEWSRNQQTKNWAQRSEVQNIYSCFFATSSRSGSLKWQRVVANEF